MARKGYTTVALPNELVTEMDRLIENKKFGYTSRGEIAKEAIRHLIIYTKKR